MPTSTGVAGSGPVAAETSPTGRPASASSCSLARLTPTLSSRNTLEPHEAQTMGRDVAQRRQTIASPTTATGAPHCSQVASSPQASQADNWARPFRLSTHTTRDPLLSTETRPDE